MTFTIHNNVGNHLDPQKTNIRIQAFLEDTEFLMEPNPYGEYSFTFAPCTDQDHHRLYENIEKWISEVEVGFGPYSDVQVEAKVKLPKGLSQCSQLFQPKLNCEPPFNEWLYGREASLNLYLRNGPDGSIFLQCSYLDLMDPYCGLSLQEMDEESRKSMELVPADDDSWDW